MKRDARYEYHKTNVDPRVRAESRVTMADYLSAYLDPCVLEESRINTMIHIIFNVYSKYKGLPLALASNYTLTDTGITDQATLAYVEACLTDVNDFVLSDLKNFLKNMDLNQTMDEIGQDLESMTELVPECVFYIIEEGL